MKTFADSKTIAPPSQSSLVSLVRSVFERPFASFILLGRGRHVSTKPNIITRNDLLKAAELSEAGVAVRSGSRSPGEVHRKSRRTSVR